MVGVDPGGERWAAVEEGCKGLLDARGWAFMDLHLMLVFSHGRPTESAARAAVAEQIVKVCMHTASGCGLLLRSEAVIGHGVSAAHALLRISLPCWAIGIWWHSCGR